MKTLQRIALTLALASTAALGCKDDDGPAKVTDAGTSAPDGGGTPAPDGGATPDGAPGQLVFKDWVHDLVTTWHKDTTDPDSVNDKETRLVFTEDETAFDDVLK
jgi:hypothetical protein